MGVKCRQRDRVRLRTALAMVRKRTLCGLFASSNEQEIVIMLFSREAYAPFLPRSNSSRIFPNNDDTLMGLRSSASKPALVIAPC
jgi:hypothetical protein